jgi:hypothetical protein
MTWFLGDGSALAKGATVEDVVCKVMISLFGEVESQHGTRPCRRRWNPQKYPDPWIYLRLFLVTELNNLAVSADNKRNNRDVPDDSVVTDETPEQKLIDVELDTEHEELIQALYGKLIDEIGDNEGLVRLHDLMLNTSVTKPQEIAKHLNLSVNEANNLKRRLFRAAVRARASLEKERTDE